MDYIDRWLDDVLCGLGISEVGDLSPSLCKKPMKDVSAEWLCDSLTYMRDLNNKLRELKSTIDPVKTDLINSQKEVIALQTELLSCKDEKIQTMQSAVRSSVEESVKAEFVTYSSKLQSAVVPKIAPDTVKSVLKTVVEEKDRSNNLIVFGLSENANETLSDSVNEIFEHLGEKQKFDAVWLGHRALEIMRKRDLSRLYLAAV